MKQKENEITENWQTFSAACSELLTGTQKEIQRISKEAATAFSGDTDMRAMRLTQVAGHFGSTAELIERARNMAYLAAASLYMEAFEEFKKKGDALRSMSLTARSVVACHYKAGNREKALELIILWSGESWLLPEVLAEFDSICKEYAEIGTEKKDED